MDALEGKLGHSFKDQALLRRALTHASADSTVSNERLEFLGDRVLGLVIAEALHQRYPDEPEGMLTRRLHALVRWESCARVGEEIRLWPELVLTKSGAADEGGRARGAIVGSAVEALIAALYLDGGLEVARTFIERHWLPLLDVIQTEQRDAKTRLQEWSQSGGRGERGAPVYALVSRDGPDHAPHFVIEVRVQGHEAARGEGASKREAEQAAAAALLAREDVQ
ncbi:MAG: ribonuclease III [Alphaproteobacteria bacterium]|nr:ribonuclease III [Alphaproteobacteria bacterium]